MAKKKLCPTGERSVRSKRQQRRVKEECRGRTAQRDFSLGCPGVGGVGGEVTETLHTGSAGKESGAFCLRALKVGFGGQFT